MGGMLTLAERRERLSAGGEKLVALVVCELDEVDAFTFGGLHQFLLAAISFHPPEIALAHRGFARSHFLDPCFERLLTHALISQLSEDSIRMADQLSAMRHLAAIGEVTLEIRKRTLVHGLELSNERQTPFIGRVLGNGHHLRPQPSAL